MSRGRVVRRCSACERSARIRSALLLACGIALVAITVIPARAATPIGTEFQINTYTTSHQRLPVVAADADGDFVVVWASLLQEGSDYGVFGQRYDSSGTVVGSEFQINTQVADYQEPGSVAVDSDGDFVVVWESYSQDGDHFGVFGQRYDSSGGAQGSEFQVNTYTTSAQRFPLAASDSAGNFVVVWSSRGQDKFDGNIIFGEYGVFGQRYDNGGVPVGSEFQVNTYTTLAQLAGGVAMDGDGDFVVTWTSVAGELGDASFGVYAQRYSSDGAPAGTEFRVNTYTSGVQHYPAVAADSDGDFVIVWTGENDQDGNLAGVFGQRYDSNGVAVGTEFQVNTYTTSYQRAASVTADSDGDFIVMWGSVGQDGSAGGVFGQRYASSGIPQGVEFQINTQTTADQIPGTVAADSDGNFVVVWQSFDQDGSGYGIFAQRYSNVLEATATPLPTPTNTPIPPFCPPSPADGCRSAGKSNLLIKNESDDAKDKLIWKWLYGQSTTEAELGAPQTARTYGLCIYTANGPLLGVEVPPSATKWVGFKYKDDSGAADGIQKIVLKGSAENKTKILVKGKGVNLPDPTLGSVMAPVRVQLINDETSLCFEATFDLSTITKNKVDMFKAKVAN